MHGTVERSFTPSPDLIIETEASRMGWGAVCQGVRTGGLWSQPFRWDAFVGSLQSGSCSVGVGLETQYLPQCRAHSGQSERFRSLGVAQFSRFEQLETLSGNFPFPNANPIRGPCTIDLFADRLNCQLPRFCSWKPDPMALATDAFQQNWSTGRNYAFPHSV